VLESKKWRHSFDRDWLPSEMCSQARRMISPGSATATSSQPACFSISLHSAVHTYLGEELAKQRIPDKHDIDLCTDLRKAGITYQGRLRSKTFKPAMKSTMSAVIMISEHASVKRCTEDCLGPNSHSTPPGTSNHYSLCA